MSRAQGQESWEQPGHVCIADEWCPCGHWPRSLREVHTPGARGKVSLDVIEQYDDRNSAQVDR